MDIVARRYAKALYLAAGKDAASVLADLEKLSQLESQSHEWQAFTRNPLYKSHQSHRILKPVLKALKLHALTEKFISLLVDKGRMIHFTQILEASIALFNRQSGRKYADVKSAFPIDMQSQGLLASFLSKKFGGDVQLNNTIDPKLLGGFAIQIDSSLYDATIRTQLNTIQRQLREI